jgi:hypothetical protein
MEKRITLDDTKKIQYWLREKNRWLVADKTNQTNWWSCSSSRRKGSSRDWQATPNSQDCVQRVEHLALSIIFAGQDAPYLNPLMYPCLLESRKQLLEIRAASPSIGVWKANSLPPTTIQLSHLAVFRRAALQVQAHFRRFLETEWCCYFLKDSGELDI